jgi:hypothetical protein
MRRHARNASCLTALGLVLLLGGCGGEQSVVHFQGAPHASISKATLNHWMRSIVGADFRTSIAKQGPTGLVSEPADYERCIDAAKLVAPRSMFNQLRLGRTKLDLICHELYRTVKAQALGFLISAQWTLAEASRAGITVDAVELKRAFAGIRGPRFPTEQSLRKYERERQLSLADLLYQVRVDTLVSRLLPRFERQVAAAGGGESAYAKLALAHYHELITKTTCEKGYVVPGCSAYRGPAGGPTPANVILTELVGKTTATKFAPTL